MVNNTMSKAQSNQMRTAQRDEEGPHGLIRPSQCVECIRQASITRQPGRATNFSEKEKNAIAHYQSYWRRWGVTRCMDGYVFDESVAGVLALYSLRDRGLIKTTSGGPGTYGHTDFDPTPELFQIDIGAHECPCEG